MSAFLINIIFVSFLKKDFLFILTGIVILVLLHIQYAVIIYSWFKNTDDDKVHSQTCTSQTAHQPIKSPVYFFSSRCIKCLLHPFPTAQLTALIQDIIYCMLNHLVDEFVSTEPIRYCNSDSMYMNASFASTRLVLRKNPAELAIFV